MSVENFVATIIDTEDTIIFRIQVAQNKIQEFRKLKDEIQNRLSLGQIAGQNQNQQESRLLVQIIEATNLEPYIQGA